MDIDLNKLRLANHEIEELKPEVGFRMQTKVIMEDEGTDFVGTQLDRGDDSTGEDGDKSITPKTDYNLHTGTLDPVARYRIVNPGTGQLKTYTAVGFDEGFYKTLLNNRDESRLRRPFNHSVRTELNHANFFQSLKEGQPVISATTQQLDKFYIEQGLDAKLVSDFLLKSTPQHKMDVIEVPNPGSKERLAQNASDIINQHTIVPLDIQKGHILWGKMLNEQAIVISANFVSQYLNKLKSKVAIPDSWILNPWTNIENPSLVPYFGLLLTQLSYHLIHPLAEKYLEPRSRSYMFYSVSTSPGHFAKHEFATKPEQDVLSSYLKSRYQIPTTPQSAFAEKLAKRIADLNKSSEWENAYPELRSFVGEISNN